MHTTPERQSLHIISTGDIHGALLPVDFLRDAPATSSLAHVAGYVAQLRRSEGSHNLLMLDCGDMLQGGPAAYYFNYLHDASQPHPVAQMMCHIGYDAMTIGNHDIETGHGVFDRFKRDLHPAPLLGANVTDISGSPYFTPYALFERGGRRVAVIGLTTEAVAEWVPRQARKGLRVGAMVDAARRWVDYVRAHHHPDLIVGLFHSGYEPSPTITSTLPENLSARIACEVPGFDLIVMGHDHRKAIRRTDSGTLLVDSGAYASHLVDVTVGADGTLTAELVDLRSVTPDTEFIDRFAPLGRKVADYVGRPIGYADRSYCSDETLGEVSPFMRVIHRAQLRASGASVSLAAPVSLGVTIGPGTLTVADLYRFYRFDNGLCVMQLTVGELRRYLAYSRRLLNRYRAGEKVPAYDLDTAMGRLPDDDADDGEIVDVTLNTYRACGGGGHLTLGAGIEPSDLDGRIVRTLPGTLRDAIEELFTLPSCGPREGKLS